MKYLLIGRKQTHAQDFPSDLAARKHAIERPKIDRVETEAGRVVYRRAPQELPDMDMVEWFDRARP